MRAFVASADSNAKTEEYDNVAGKKLAFLGRFNYGTYISMTSEGELLLGGCES